VVVWWLEDRTLSGFSAAILLAFFGTLAAQAFVYLELFS
jgi:hypothetical protein